MLVGSLGWCVVADFGDRRGADGTVTVAPSADRA